jgi:hypothetical protein
LLRGGPEVSTRPDPEVWSALEYGCHVRDVFVIMDVRLGLILDRENPEFPNWDQDATAVAEHYDEQEATRR